MTDETILLRQVNPSWYQAGRVTSQVFKPTKKDEGLLSVYDGDMISPDLSWKHYTHDRGFSSMGVLGVQNVECTELELEVQPDPSEFPEHVYINFSECSRSKVETRAKALRYKAIKRGWLYKDE